MPSMTERQNATSSHPSAAAKEKWVMLHWTTIRIDIVDDLTLEDEDLEDIDIAEAIEALEENLPELPKGANWKVTS